jgi:chemotaxis protein MotA
MASEEGLQASTTPKAAPKPAGQSIDISTVAGLALGFGAVLLSVVIEGGSLGSLVNVPAAMLVLGGTIGVSMLCFPLSVITGLPKVVMKAFFSKKEDPIELINMMTALARKARQEGVLGLESDERVTADKLLSVGMQLVVDGADSDKIRSILESELVNMEERHETGAGFFESAGGYAPTMGIIGTVMGLVNVLGELGSSDMEKLGEAIAGAFIATLYGVGSANLFFLPFGTKLRNKSRHEVNYSRMVIEGVLAIQAGEHPNVIKQRMMAFLKPAERAKLQEE